MLPAQCRWAVQEAGAWNSRADPKVGAERNAASPMGTDGVRGDWPRSQSLRWSDDVPRSREKAGSIREVCEQVTGTVTTAEFRALSPAQGEMGPQL